MLMFSSREKSVIAPIWRVRGYSSECKQPDSLQRKWEGKSDVPLSLSSNQPLADQRREASEPPLSAPFFSSLLLSPLDSTPSYSHFPADCLSSEPGSGAAMATDVT